MGSIEDGALLDEHRERRKLERKARFRRRNISAVLELSGIAMIGIATATDGLTCLLLAYSSGYMMAFAHYGLRHR